MTFAGLALVIAANHWPPAAARGPLRSLAFVGAGVLVGLVGFVLAELVHLRRTDWRPPGPAAPLRDSLRAILITTTAACILLAIATRFTWTSDWLAFTTYGLAALTASLIVVARFVRRSSGDKRATTAGQESGVRTQMSGYRRQETGGR